MKLSEANTVFTMNIESSVAEFGVRFPANNLDFS